MEILKLLIQVITFLFGIFMLSSCSNGWYLGNLHLGSNDSSYVALVDQDSVTHHYVIANSKTGNLFSKPIMGKRFK